MAFADIYLVARRLRGTVALLLSIATLLLGRVTTLLLRRSAILLLGRVSLLLTAIAALLLTAIAALLLTAVAWRSTRGRRELVLATVAALLLRGSTISGSSTLRTVRLLVLGVVRGIDCTEDQLEDLWRRVSHCSQSDTGVVAYPEIGSEIDRGVSACHLSRFVLEV
jgi:hypothetical protein